MSFHLKMPFVKCIPFISCIKFINGENIAIHRHSKKKEIHSLPGHQLTNIKELAFLNGIFVFQMTYCKLKIHTCNARESCLMVQLEAAPSHIVEVLHCIKLVLGSSHPVKLQFSTCLRSLSKLISALH